jgi:uncharacterized membrane protein
MFSLREAVIVGPVAGILAALVLLTWSWARLRFRFAVAGLATAIGAVLWNLALWNANATNMDVDGPVFRLSYQDVGSGVLAFAGVALVLGLGIEPAEPARRVVTAAGIAGVVTMILDLFV